MSELGVGGSQALGVGGSLGDSHTFTHTRVRACTGPLNPRLIGPSPGSEFTSRLGAGFRVASPLTGPRLAQPGQERRRLPHRGRHRGSRLKGVSIAAFPAFPLFRSPLSRPSPFLGWRNRAEGFRGGPDRSGEHAVRAPAGGRRLWFRRRSESCLSRRSRGPRSTLVRRPDGLQGYGLCKGPDHEDPSSAGRWLSQAKSG